MVDADGEPGRRAARDSCKLRALGLKVQGALDWGAPIGRGKMSDRRTSRQPRRLELPRVPRDRPRPPSRPELHVCGTCGSAPRLPARLGADDGQALGVALRCPECEWRGGGIYEQALVDRFDEVLDDGTSRSSTTSTLLTRANMEDAGRALRRGARTRT